MTTKLLYLFTRTPLHVGAGSSVGAIDQPIIRERHTGFPIIPGSSIKGVMADANGASSNPNTERSAANRELFGSTQSDDNKAYGGSLSFGEGKIMLFSVRTAQGCFAWITCPLVLAHWFTCRGKPMPKLPTLAAQGILADAQTISASGKAVLEDTVASIICPVPAEIASPIADLLTKAAPAFAPHSSGHLAIVSDELFSHLVSTCCEVQQHVRIDDDSGTAAPGALFNQENVPSECLFFAPISELRDNALVKLDVPAVLQIGADSTTGLGFCDTRLLEN